MVDPESLPIPDLGLRCLGCGYMLAGLPRHLCPECGREVRIEQHIPPGDFPLIVFDGKAVVVTQEVRALLQRYRIPFLENKTHSETIMISVGVPTNSPGHLCVPRGRYFEVIDLMRRQRYGEAMPESFEPVIATEEWDCPGCGESNPGNFEVCWNCEKERVADAAQ